MEQNKKSGLTPVRADGTMLFLDAEGKKVFDEVSKTDVDDYYIVKDGRKYGCVDDAGTYITDCTYKKLSLEELCDEKIKARINGDLNFISVYGGVLYDAVEEENEYGFSLAQRDKKYGYLSTDGKEIVPLQYSDVSMGERQDNGCIPLELDGEKNFLDPEGGLLYAYVGEYGTNGLAVACNLDGLYGYIDENGEAVIDFWLMEAKDFGDSSLAPVRAENGYWGYMNQLGTAVTEMNYDEASGFNEEGYAFVKFGEIYNFIDEQGIEQFDYITPFYETTAIGMRDGKYGLVDESGRVLTNTWYDMIYEEEEYLAVGIARARLDGKYVLLGLDGIERSDYYDGILERYAAGYYHWGEDGESLDVMQKTDTLIFWIDGAYGMLDVQGNVVAKPEYASISATSREGTREVKFANGEVGAINEEGEILLRGAYDFIDCYAGPYFFTVQAGEKCGAYTGAGEEILPQDYDGISFISNSGFDTDSMAEAYIIAEKNGKEALADTNGNFLTDFKYDAIEYVEDELFIAKIDEKWGASDLEGNTCIVYQYSHMRPCRNEALGAVIAEDDSGRCGCLDKEGQVTVPFAYESLYIEEPNLNLDYSYMEAEVDGKWGVLREDLEWIVPPQYDYTLIMDNGYICVTQNDKDGILDMEGNVVLMPMYDWIGIVEDGKCSNIQSGEFYGVVNDRYEIIVPIEYEYVSIYGENASVYVAESADGTFSLYSAEGELVLSEMNWISSPGTGGFLTVIRNEEDETAEIYDLQGRYRETINSRLVSIFRSGMAKIYEDGYYGFINLKGEQVVPCSYRDAELFSEDGIASVYDEGGWGYIDQTGQPITEFLYAEAEDFNYGYGVAALEEGKTGLITAAGETIVPFQYNDIDLWDNYIELFTDEQAIKMDYAGNVLSAENVEE